MDSANLIIEDKDTTREYTLSEVKNRIVWGSSLDLLPRLEAECADMVFIYPPYFLQLPNKELRRWNVKTVVEGVNNPSQEGKYTSESHRSHTPSLDSGSQRRLAVMAKRSRSFGALYRPFF